MKIDKPSDADKDYFVELFGDRPEVQVKAMFGNLAAFVETNEQMCAGLFGPLVGLRLDESDRDALMAEPGAGPFGPAERPMKEYVSLPPTWRADDSGAVESWVDRAIAHTASLPAKKKKTPKKKAPQKKS